MAKHNRDKPLPANRAPRGALPGRSFARTQGCHNCTHFIKGESETAQKFFDICKKRDLATAEAHALIDPRGQNAPKVQQIMRTVAAAEVSIKLGQFGMCTSKSPEAAKSDFVERTHLCGGWTAATGASVDRAGSGLDTLPQELEDKIS